MPELRTSLDLLPTWVLKAAAFSVYYRAVGPTSFG